MQSAPKKIALVTGANKGIGFEVARQLAASGCTVLLGARNQVLGEEAAAKLKSYDVRYLAIDLDDSATIPLPHKLSMPISAISTSSSIMPASSSQGDGLPSSSQYRGHRADLPRKLPGQRGRNSSHASAVAQGSIREHRKCVERARIAHQKW